MSGAKAETNREVTLWIEDLECGDLRAASLLWGYYEDRLKRFSRSCLSPKLRRVYDERDLSSAAFLVMLDVVFHKKNVRNRADFWALLSSIVRNQARNRSHAEQAQKRGGGEIRGESVWQLGDLFEFSAGGMAPDGLVVFREQLEVFAKTLPEPILQQLLMMMLEGHEQSVICSRLELSQRSLRRKLTLLRRLWEDSQNALD